MSSYSELKEKQRTLRDAFPTDMGMRVHRALSWLNRAEQCENDEDSRVIFLWIAFNAAYANDVDAQYRQRESAMFSQFLKLLHELDSKRLLSNVVWQQFSSAIRLLLGNQFVYQPFWDAHNNPEGDQDWKSRFKAESDFVNRAMGRQDTAEVLSVVFSRIYTLRNQLVHGGATWNSQVNRAQVRDCSAMLQALVPAIIDIMLDNPSRFVGSHHYPVVELGR
ncbi:HEPN domain-containing protein [Paraferrimonas haliotis]|uniref:Apea-like HEPN domain-containing protein n=1 Tax=Paraferrimonas haliotis TaxID=2013866 RepID=A0AA37WXN9_9GAMM|nr:HEPN domain-containing protein [Paraferrimonas haliotis]GLS83689.1 hypothetical protein GCM10007894_16660 [Paraferrimonas haliotis]